MISSDFLKTSVVFVFLPEKRIKTLVLQILPLLTEI